MFNNIHSKMKIKQINETQKADSDAEFFVHKSNVDFMHVSAHRVAHWGYFPPTACSACSVSVPSPCSKATCQRFIWNFAAGQIYGSHTTLKCLILLLLFMACMAIICCIWACCTSWIGCSYSAKTIRYVYSMQLCTYKVSTRSVPS